MEHFRPKGRVRAWPATPDQYDFPTGAEAKNGYYKLAYHLGNYVATCKRCNEDFKKDYFPVAADRILLAATPSACASEQAFLIYPLGITAEDPEKHIAFNGVEAEPRTQRGRVMIDLLGLNREDLQAARAFWLLYTVWPALKLARIAGGQRREKFAYYESPMAEHTNCTRQFVALYDADPAAAEKLLEDFKLIIALHFKDRPGKRA